MAPSVLYRYRSLAGDSFKHTQDIFLRRRLYLPLASSMNDPSEGRCGLEFPPIPPTATPAERWGMGNQAWGMSIRHGQARAGFRLASFSANCTNPLLWAHYADSHRGICIGLAVGKSPGLSAAIEVGYQHEPPTWRGDDEDLVQRVFCTKWSHWSYEQEWRIVSRDEAYVSLPAGSLFVVVLGARTSEEDEAWVRDWIAVTGGGVPIKKAKLSEKNYEMSIE